MYVDSLYHKILNELIITGTSISLVILRFCLFYLLFMIYTKPILTYEYN